VLAASPAPSIVIGGRVTVTHVPSLRNGITTAEDIVQEPRERGGRVARRKTLLAHFGRWSSQMKVEQVANNNKVIIKTERKKKTGE